MTSRAAVDAMETLCHALDGGDVRPLAARLDEQSLLRVPGHSGLGGDYHGRDAIAGVLRRMAVASGGTLRFDVHGATARRGVVRIEGAMSCAGHCGRASASVWLDAVLEGAILRRVTIECTDRSAWDALWGRARR